MDAVAGCTGISHLTSHYFPCISRWLLIFDHYLFGDSIVCKFWSLSWTPQWRFTMHHCLCIITEHFVISSVSDISGYILSLSLLGFFLYFIDELPLISCLISNIRQVEVTGGRVVRAGLSVTRNVLSWSDGHEFKPDRVELGVHCTSVLCHIWTKNIIVSTSCNSFLWFYGQCIVVCIAFISVHCYPVLCHFEMTIRWNISVGCISIYYHDRSIKYNKVKFLIIQSCQVLLNISSLLLIRSTKHWKTGRKFKKLIMMILKYGNFLHIAVEKKSLKVTKHC